MTKTLPFLLLLVASQAIAEVAMIEKGVSAVEVSLDDQQCTIQRSGQQGYDAYARTDQGMPQPIELAPGLQTLGELEFIDYMVKASSDDSILVIDTRTEDWHERLHIPCTTNVSFKNFADNRDDALFYLTEVFGAEENDDGSLSFDNAKTVVGYCNGYWCGQTPAMYKNAKFSLLNLGYPADKLKYYRGGM